MDTLIVVVGIFAVGAITPGPNNFMVMAAGARGGLSAAGPVIGGVVLGGLVLLGLAWSGVAAVLETAPHLRLALTGAGAAYLVWLGGGMIWKDGRLARASPGSPSPRAFPSSWLGIAAFQLLNPKAWVLLVTATAVMSRTLEGLRGLGTLAAIYSVRSAFSLTAWAVAGSVIGRCLTKVGAQRRLDRMMGGLLVALAVALVAGEL